MLKRYSVVLLLKENDLLFLKNSLFKLFKSIDCLYINEIIFLGSFKLIKSYNKAYLFSVIVLMDSYLVSFLLFKFKFISFILRFKIMLSISFLDNLNCFKFFYINLPKFLYENSLLKPRLKLNFNLKYYKTVVLFVKLMRFFLIIPSYSFVIHKLNN